MKPHSVDLKKMSAKYSIGTMLLFGAQLFCEPVFAEEEEKELVDHPTQIVAIRGSGPSPVIEVVINGLGSTKQETLIDLLPRSLPTEISENELAEFSRRVKNLGIFDTVSVERIGSKLIIDVSRKRTLSPVIDLSTGKTWEDLSATLGASEYDFMGQGTRLGGKASYSERNPNITAWIEEHAYSPNRWATEYELYRLSSSFRFADSPLTWTRNRTGGFAEWISPFYYGSHILYEFQLQAYYEDYSKDDPTLLMTSGTYVGGLFEIIYDRYKWDDLHPTGYKLVVEFRPGAIAGGRFRGESRFKVLSAFSLSNNLTLLMNGIAGVVNSGDVNHSLLIGSQQGVRGLSDSFYRTSAAVYLNTEIRYAVRAANKFFLQPTLFIDVGTFEPMNINGERTDWLDALSTGLGLRLVPTGWTNFLFRADASRIHSPTDEWLVQVGITQYF
jgi:hypothetical protein